MLNSEPNNQSWQEALEQIELNAPDLMLDKKASWDNLYQRLERPTRRSPLIFLKWAAVLIGISSLLFSYWGNRNSGTTITTDGNSLGKNGSQKTLPPTISVPPIVTEEIGSQKDNKKTGKSLLVSTSTTPVKKIHATKPVVMPVQESAVELALVSPIHISVPVTDTFHPIALTSALEKKKLRVIHINDYSAPVKPDIFMVDNLSGNKHNRILVKKSFSEGDYNMEGLASPAASAIKIKLSTQN